ncbi:DUF1056 family protein [Ligilactobacillus equi]
MIKLIWKVIDLICYILALGFFVWGFFRLNFTTGIFSLGFSFIILGILSEVIAWKGGE